MRLAALKRTISKFPSGFKVKPPYVPHVKDDADASHFDDYPEEETTDTAVPKMLYETEFADF